MLYGRSFAWSGDDGRFVFDDVGDVEDLAVLAVAPGHPTTFLDLTSQATRDVRIVLHREQTLSVKVVAPDGETPLEGVRIVLIAGEDADLAGKGAQGLFAGTTGENGI